MDFRLWLTTGGTDRSLGVGIRNALESIASSVVLLVVFLVQYDCLSVFYNYIQVEDLVLGAAPSSRPPFSHG